MISIKNSVQATSVDISNLIAENALFLGCICEMMENVEWKLRFTTNTEELLQLKVHKKVIRKVLANSLNLN